MKTPVKILSQVNWVSKRLDPDHMHEEIKKLKELSKGIQPSLRIVQVQQLLNVSRSTVYRLLDEKQLIGFKIRGSLRITHSSIETYQQRQIQEFMENED